MQHHHRMRPQSGPRLVRGMSSAFYPRLFSLSLLLLLLLLFTSRLDFQVAAAVGVVEISLYKSPGFVNAPAPHRPPLLARPRSFGIDNTGPDDSDLHNLRLTNADNNTRKSNKKMGNLLDSNGNCIQANCLSPMGPNGASDTATSSGFGT